MMDSDVAERKHLDLREGVEARPWMICPSYPSVQAVQATSRHPHNHRGSPKMFCPFFLSVQADQAIRRYPYSHRGSLR